MENGPLTYIENFSADFSAISIFTLGGIMRPVVSNVNIDANAKSLSHPTEL